MNTLIKSLKLISILVLLSSHAFTQVSHVIDEFTNNANYYTAFNNGTGSASTTINTSDFASGSESLSINYSFDAGTGYFFSSFRNYSTATQDYSYQTIGFSLYHKGGNVNSSIAIRLWEDNNMNGVFDGTDEVFASTSVTSGESGWTQDHFAIGDFTLVTGTGNGTLDLNRIRAWDIKVQNETTTAQSGTLLVDQLVLESSYTSPATGNNILSGSFIQLWNSTGCSCGQWSQTEWNNELQEMSDLCMDKFIIQYSVYDDLSWYSNSSLSFVNFKEGALDKIITAAESAGIQIYFGLYFDETWNTADKSLAATYSDLLTKHQGVIDELWTEFGASSAFGGWYIPQEINDLEWQTDPEKTLLFDWLKDVSDYAKTKSSAPVIIAPFFNLWQPADVVADWYDELFMVATNIDAIYPQDGVGITLKDVDYHIPLYFSELESLCNTHGVDFGATVESFEQQTGWPIDGGSFSAISADIDRLKSQLWNAQDAGAIDIIQFSWSYMQDGVSASASQLNTDYANYSSGSCTATSVFDSNSSPLIIYPNPATDELYVSGCEEEVKVYDVLGVDRTSEVDQRKLQTDMWNLDITQLPANIYLIRVGGQSLVFVKK